jgi:hypothetical protein
MEPNTAVTAWTIAKTAGEISKKLYEFGKSQRDHKLKEQVEEILDKLRDLKQSAAELEDENRELRDKLHFKSNDYEFRNPFWYAKTQQNQPLCAKCFAKETVGPMGEPGYECRSNYRRCLVCGSCVQVGSDTQGLFRRQAGHGI